MDVLSKPSVPSGLFKANGIDYLLPPTEQAGVMLNDGAGNVAWGPAPYVNAVPNGELLSWALGTSFPGLGITFPETADNTYWQANGSGIVTISRSLDVPTVSAIRPGTPYSLLVTPTTADASIATGDIYLLTWYVPAPNMRAIANGFICTFQVKAAKTGTYCISFHDTGFSFSYVVEFQINTANTWEDKACVVPSPASTGAFVYGADLGDSMEVDVALAAGSSFYTTPNAWQNASAFATSNQVNGLDNVADLFRIANLWIVPGTTPVGAVPHPGTVFARRSPATLAFGASALPGTSYFPARLDHGHGMPTTADIVAAVAGDPRMTWPLLLMGG